MKNFIFSPLILLILFFLPGKLQSQQWEFAREKDGITISTRPEAGSHYKAFKGEVELHASIDLISRMLEDVEQFDVWDEDISEIRVLEHDPGKSLRYYVVYDLPWPFTDRDLCVEAVFSSEPASLARILQSRSVPEAVPLNEDHVRIVNYWQKWIIQPLEGGLVRLTVEGFADPAGDIPAWIANMAITDTPLNMLGSIREEVE